MINFIHPYPVIQSSTQVYLTNRLGNATNLAEHSIKEIDSQTHLYKNPEIMQRDDLYPHKINMDHNEIARRLLDKIT